jgi:hypothetical protein
MVVRTDLNNHSEKCPCNGTCFLEPYYLSARLICDRLKRSIALKRHPRRTNMLRNFTFALFAAAALAAMALAPSSASARGAGGWGGGSSHNHQSSPRLGTRFIGPAVQKMGLAPASSGPRSIVTTGMALASALSAPAIWDPAILATAISTTAATWCGAYPRGSAIACAPLTFAFIDQPRFACSETPRSLASGRAFLFSDARSRVPNPPRLRR